MPHDKVLTADMRRSVEVCLECERICTEAVRHCLELGGAHASATHIGLLLDCASICQTSAEFMLRGSPHHPRVCGACAEVCQACATACDRLGDDELMRRCAEVCRRCATACQQMAGMAMK